MHFAQINAQRHNKGEMPVHASVMATDGLEDKE